jgi:uncharacterized GH25 family protein
MKRLCSLLLVLALTTTAQAHFVWLVPDPPDKGTRKTRLIFSDTTAPDDAKLLEKIKQTEVWARGGDGKTVAVKKGDVKDGGIEATIPGEGVFTVAAVCPYGVVKRGDAEPYLLTYYAKTFVGSAPRDERAKVLGKPWGKELVLEIVPAVEKRGAFVQVLWQGKPLADAEVVLMVPGVDKGVEKKTDKDGYCELVEPKKGGTYGIRARHTTAIKGDLDGKKYSEARAYATLTLPVSDDAVGPSANPENETKLEKEIREAERAAAAADDAASKATNAADRERFQAESAKQKALAAVKVDELRKLRAIRNADQKEAKSEDPAASRLLAEARAARANWHDFPGFTADLEYNDDGKVYKGKLSVGAKGAVTVTLSGAADDATSWVRGTLKSIVGHRTDNSAALKTPCAFADDDTHHPLGRAVKVLDDEFHSSYRIRDRQIIVVNRRTNDVRFTITVLENRLNDDKQYLSGTFVVNTWDLKTDALRSSQTHTQTWRRIGKFDLPDTLLVLTATAGKQEARSIKLTNHQLAGKK